MRHSFRSHAGRPEPGAVVEGVDLARVDWSRGGATPDRARPQNAWSHGADLRGASTKAVDRHSFELTGVRIDLVHAVQVARTHGALVAD